jgi:DNA-binding NtrC family response regulator
MNKKRKDVSVTEKFQLIDTYDKSTKKSKREVADKLGIPQSTLSKLLKSHDMLNVNISETERGSAKKNVMH